MEERPEARHDEPATAVPFLARLSGFAAAGLRYWEPRRLIYNGRAILLAVGTMFAATITHFFAKGMFGG